MERKQLAAAGEIFLSKTVYVVARKGDGTEPRTLVSRPVQVKFLNEGDGSQK